MSLYRAIECHILGVIDNCSKNLFLYCKPILLVDYSKTITFKQEWYHKDGYEWKIEWYAFI